MELAKLTKTQLTDPEIIAARKINFFDDMNGNLIARNIGGNLTPVLTYFSPAGTNFKNQYEGMLSNQVIKEGSRMATDDEMALIDTDLHQLAKEVNFISDLKSPIGHVIFPGGLGLINKINKTNIGSTLTTIANGFALNSGAYPGKAAIVTNMKISYTTEIERASCRERV